MLKIGTRDIKGDFPGSGGKSERITILERKGRIGKDDGIAMNLGQAEGLWNSVSTLNRNRQLPKEHHLDSLLMRWKVTHSPNWKIHLLASALSLIAFILLLVMVFSKKWLHLSASRFYQRWPADVSDRVYTSARIMSMGLLQICISKDCRNSENGKDSFKLWTNHPAFGLAKITFSLALALGFIFTIWLHLPYISGLQRLPFFGWIGTIMSFCEVTFIFFSLMLFPIAIWTFELKRNLSVPIGWSYFIGWVVFFLYVVCAFLCYFNDKNFWSLILSSPSAPPSCHSSTRSDCLNE